VGIFLTKKNKSVGENAAKKSVGLIATIRSLFIL
jgi:hypothetical protein